VRPLSLFLASSCSASSSTHLTLRLALHPSLAPLLALAEDWGKAQIDFFEAFKAYDEAGSPQRIQVLKYLVLAHMLTESDIDPFDSQETKPCVGSSALSCACTASLGVGAGLESSET